MSTSLTHPIVTGGAGFIGSNLVQLLLQHPEVEQITILDKLTYAGSRQNIPTTSRAQLHLLDITDPSRLQATLNTLKNPTCIFNLAAESHVDRSITSPSDFIKTNILGTENLIQAARTHNLPLIQISTDEVYGSIDPPHKFTETSPLAPSSPYSASKASADLLCLAAHKTYGQNIIITRCTNNYGPNQFPEKLIPLLIQKALADQPLPIYGNGLQIRDWIHVYDHCQALIAAAKKGTSGEIYNIGANEEHTNLEIAERIVNILGKPQTLITHVDDRPGHDLRYAINATKAQTQLNWKPRLTFNTTFPQEIHKIANLNNAKY